MEEYILKYYNYLYKLSYKFYPNSEDNRNDLVQDTIYRALKYKDYYKEDNIKGWLGNMMKNLFINDQRKNDRQQFICTDNFYTDYESYDEEYFKPIQGQDMDNDLILQWINNLPVKYNSVIILWMQGYKYKEIAEILEIPCGTVKSAIFFIRIKLEKYLNNDYVFKRRSRKN